MLSIWWKKVQFQIYILQEMWLRWFVSSAWAGLTEQTSAAQLHWDTRAALTGQRRNYSRTSQSVSARWRLPLAPRRRDRIQPTCLEQSACAQTKISFQFRVVKDTTEIHLLGKKISQQCFLPKKKKFQGIYWKTSLASSSTCQATSHFKIFWP